MQGDATRSNGFEFTDEELARNWEGRKLAKAVRISTLDGYVDYHPGNPADPRDDGDAVLPEHYRYLGEHCFLPLDEDEAVLRGDVGVLVADGALGYDDLRVAQLVDLCRQRGIEPRSNAKASLIRQLKANDASAADNG